MTARRRSIPLTGFELSDNAEGREPIRVAVPGGVHEALVAAGRLEDPFFGGNEPAAAWVADRDWWYRATVAGVILEASERARLVFQGLDTTVEVWWNDRLLGRHENQFRPAVFDVTDDLREENLLVLCFRPPLRERGVPAVVAEEVRRISAALSAGGGEEGEDGEPNAILVNLPRATTLRKASFSWGWDFGPNLPSIGIWRPATLEIESRAALLGHRVAVTQLVEDGSAARVAVDVEVERWAEAGSLRARITLTAPTGRSVQDEIELPGDRAGTEFAIAEPELWWTHDLGEPARYELTIDLLQGEDVLDTVRERVGLRKLRLDRGTPQARRFQFVLNGVPMFARGANWLPASMFVGSVAPATHRDRVLLAREGNLNMLRIWGGGVYEQDSFYDACDELGVLVWHDFMFACIDYPDADPGLRHEVELEAVHQVRRLRNRACLALWSGNNEVQMLHAMAFGDVDEGGWGWHFFHELLPTVVAEHDGRTPYWPGSPWGEGGAPGVNSTQDGDRHTWEVWHGQVVPGVTIGPDAYPTIGDARHYRRYAYDTARFASEFGIHAAPELATLRRWLPEEELRVHAPVFDLHNKDVPKNKGDELLSVTSGLPTTLDEYVWFTQAVQAEGMAFAIEHYRRRQPETAGALVWQYNDVWPGFTWSLVDYDGVPKSSYYAVRRASAPLVVSFKDVTAEGLELWLVNNRREEVDVEIDVELGAFDGSGRRSRRITGRAGAGASVLVHTLPAAQLARDAGHYAWASSPTGAFPAARKHFAEIGQLELGSAALDVEATETRLRITAHGYAYSVRIEQPVPGMRLSDNCFDLRDGATVEIAVSGADARTLAVGSYPSTR